MQQEASQELISRQRHGALLISVCIVLPSESDLIVLKADQSMVGDRDAMGVAGQIVEHVMGSTKRWFGVNDPVFCGIAAARRS